MRWLWLVAACSSQTQTKPVSRPASTCQPSDIGESSLFTRGEPIQTCPQFGPGEGMFHIAATGSRPFSIQPPGKAVGCTHDTDTQCTSIDLGAFLADVTAKLKAVGADPVSWGLNRCSSGKSGSTSWDDLHWSFVIYHWRYANDAVAILTDALHRWDASQSFEVAVEHIQCGSPE